MTLSFACVPTDKDGNISDLFDGRKWKRKPREGVTPIPTRRGEELRFGLLDVTDENIRYFQEITQGAFLELCGGETTGRFVLLEPRHSHFEKILLLFPGLQFADTGAGHHRKRVLSIILENVEAVLQQYGARAAMLISPPY